jgi:hypothetical protein
MSDKKFDTVLLGLLLAMLLPTLAMLGFWKVKTNISLGEFLVQFQHLGMLSKVVSLSVIPNLPLFFLFIWTNRNFSARGVIFATLLLAFVMLILKFV